MPRARLDNESVKIRRRKFVKELVRTGNQTEAAMAAYPNMKRTTASIQGTKLVNRPEVKEEIRLVMAQQGLTLTELVAQKHGLISQGQEQLKDSKVTPELYNKVLDKLIDLHTDDRLRVNNTLNLNIEASTTPELLQERARYAKFFNSIVDGEQVVDKPTVAVQPPTHPKT
jgi:hypothetical protein